MKPTTLSTAAGASGFAAAVVVIISWLLQRAGVTLPAEVSVAIGTILTSVTHYLVTLDGPFRKPAQPQSQQSGDSPK